MAEFRRYTEREEEFYRLNHANQTLDFVLAKKRQYAVKNRDVLGAWEALELLDALVDQSDPDTGLSQTQHALQTAEAIRNAGLPDWFQLTGLIHDLGKMLVTFSEPQWAVVGDTFPVGCAYSDKIVFPEYFAHNPDLGNPELQTPDGIYSGRVRGLDNMHFSWGHDEYLYQVLKEADMNLPEAALYIIRYHSAYVIHREGGYQHLLDFYDWTMLSYVRRFQPFDLYSKSAAPVDVQAVRPYYEALIAKYLPEKLMW